MKSLEELKAIRDKMKGQIGMRSEHADNTRVVVGMATCGIASITTRRPRATTKAARHHWQRLNATSPTPPSPLPSTV